MGKEETHREQSHDSREVEDDGNLPTNESQEQKQGVFVHHRVGNEPDVLEHESGDHTHENPEQNAHGAHK